MRGRVSALAIALAASCTSRSLIRLDVPIEGDPKTMVVIVERDGARPSLTVLDLAADPSAYLADRTYDGAATAVNVLLYDDDPDALLLDTAGTTELDGSGCRPPPDRPKAWHASVTGNAPSAWTQLDPRGLDGLRLPAPDYDACLSIGCVELDVTTGAPLDCLPSDARCVPCEPSPVAPPVPPTMPLPASFEVEIPHPFALENCTENRIQLYGAGACEEFDDSCPPGEYRDDLPAGLVDHVKPGPSGGDGSIASPFGSIEEAISAGSAQVLALAEGTFEGVAELGGHTIVGACASKTIIERRDAQVIEARAGDVDVRHVRLRNGYHGVAAGGGARIRLEDVSIEGVTGDGIYVGPSSTVEAVRVHIRGAAINGVGVEATGTAYLLDSVIEASLRHGVLAFGEAKVVRTVIRDSGEYGVLARGGSFTSTSADIARNLRSGVVAGDGGALDFTDSIVRETTDGDSNGILLESDARGTVARVAVLSNQGLGAVRVSSRSVGLFEDLRLSANGGDGVVLSLAARATAKRTYVDSTAGTAVLVAEGASAVFEDTIITGTRAARGSAGVGMLVVSGATVTSTRTSITDTEGPALLVVGLGSTGRIWDLTVENARFHPAGPQSAVVAAEGGSLYLARAMISHVEGAGFSIGPEAAGTVRDLELADTSQPAAIGLANRSTIMLDRVRATQTRSRAVQITETAAVITNFTFTDPGEGEIAPAVDALQGATLQLDRGLIEDCRGRGIVSSVANVVVNDVTIRRAAASCLVAQGQLGASLIAERARLEDCAIGAAELRERGIINLRDSTVSSRGDGCSAGTENPDAPIFPYFDRVSFSHDDRPGFVRCRFER